VAHIQEQPLTIGYAWRGTAGAVEIKLLNPKSDARVDLPPGRGQNGNSGLAAEITYAYIAPVDKLVSDLDRIYV